MPLGSALFWRTGSTRLMIDNGDDADSREDDDDNDNDVEDEDGEKNNYIPSCLFWCITPCHSQR